MEEDKSKRKTSTSSLKIAYFTPRDMVEEVRHLQDGEEPEMEPIIIRPPTNPVPGAKPKTRTISMPAISVKTADAKEQDKKTNAAINIGVGKNAKNHPSGRHSLDESSSKEAKAAAKEKGATQRRITVSVPEETHKELLQANAIKNPARKITPYLMTPVAEVDEAELKTPTTPKDLKQELAMGLKRQRTVNNVEDVSSGSSLSTNQKKTPKNVDEALAGSSVSTNKRKTSKDKVDNGESDVHFEDVVVRYRNLDEIDASSGEHFQTSLENIKFLQTALSPDVDYLQYAAVKGKSKEEIQTAANMAQIRSQMSTSFKKFEQMTQKEN